MASPDRKTAENPTLVRPPDYSREYHERWSKEREGLQDAVGESINLDARTVGSEETLQDYLKEGLKADVLVLRALSSLQLHGYWETFLPEGYQIQIQAGKLSLFKQAEDGSREYHKAPNTDKLVHDLPLLAVIPHQDVLYFKSGGYREGLPLEKSKNKAEACQMVENALTEGRFAKLTGMVNGLKISDKVRLGARHKVAAQEMLFLLDKASSVFDEETLAWIHRSGNLEDLKALAEGEWGVMNRPGTEAFQRARSAEGVIQLTLAWRRLRSVLPTDLVNEIRKNSLEPDKISSLQMTLAQTEATSGKALVEDRKVVVESVILSKPQLSIQVQNSQTPSPPKIQPEPPDAQPNTPEPEKPGKADVSDDQEVVFKEGEQPLEDEEATQEPAPKVESQGEETDPVEPVQDGADTIKEPDEQLKSPEEIAQEAWEEQNGLLDFLISEYPEIDFTIEDRGPFTKLVTFSYSGAGLTVQGGGSLDLKRVTRIQLPKSKGEKPVFETENVENLRNFGGIITNFAESIKKEIETPAKAELEDLLQKNIVDLPRREKRALGKTGDFDEVVGKIREHYTAKSLKLNTLLGFGTEIETTYFTGGLLGQAPVKILVAESKGEIGLEISGGKIKNKIFYSLESDAEYEIK